MRNRQEKRYPDDICACKLLSIDLPRLISFIGQFAFNRSMNRFTAWQFQTVLHMVPCLMQKGTIQKHWIHQMDRCFVLLRSQENCSIIAGGWIIWSVEAKSRLIHFLYIFLV